MLNIEKALLFGALLVLITVIIEYNDMKSENYFLYKKVNCIAGNNMWIHNEKCFVVAPNVNPNMQSSTCWINRFKFDTCEMIKEMPKIPILPMFICQIVLVGLTVYFFSPHNYNEDRMG